MLAEDINGKFFRVIFNIYKGAKSCVSVGGNAPVSNFFNCLIGVRQGENLSPLLFAIFLNDLESFMSTKFRGLQYLQRNVADLLGDDDVTVYLNLFVLLYADDTIILAENAEDLQLALDGMSEYCRLNKLYINTTKTKVMIFSRGKVRNFPRFTYDEEHIEVVEKYTYLGTCMNYNGNCVPNLKALSVLANKAMFAVLQKGKHLEIDTMLHLFDTMVMPILLYGSEIWGYCNIEIIERVHLRFCKILLKLQKSTTNVMVYGELGRYPLSLCIKVRMVCFWHKLVNDNSSKLSSTMYKLLYKRYSNNTNVSKWLLFTKNILDNVGLGNVWLDQGQSVSKEWLKLKLKQVLLDQYIQKWESDVHESSKCLNYRIFKTSFGHESYLIDMTTNLRILFTKFRCRNSKLPIESGIFVGTPREDRLCNLCNRDEIGDEFHYIFSCDVFKGQRRASLKKYYWQHPSAFKMQLLFNSEGTELLNLCKFVKIIMSSVK
jgi:hypothetical protein